MAGIMEMERETIDLSDCRGMLYTILTRVQHAKDSAKGSIDGSLVNYEAPLPRKIYKGCCKQSTEAILNR